MYGEPDKCYADHGAQILAGASKLGGATGAGTGVGKAQWVFTATGCSWRNGAAEVTIRSARHTLAHVLDKGGRHMNFHEVDSTLRRVGEILNRRPLVVKVGQDDQYYSITPADLLLGKAAEAPSSTVERVLREADEEVREMFTAQKRLAREWGREWTRSYFPTLVPRTKWKSSSRNV